MKRWTLFLLLVVLVALAGGCDATSGSAVETGGGAVTTTHAALAAPTGNDYPTGLVVVGTGTAEADPDVAYLTLGVDLRGDDPAAVVEDAAGRMERLLAGIQGAGVAEEEIRTVDYSLWVEQVYDPDTGRPTGKITYHVVHTVRVTVRDLARTGEVLSAAVAAGANQIQDVRFSVEDTAALNEQARKLAIQDAVAKAEQMAGELGIKLGRVISVSESGGATPIPLYADAALRESAPAAVPLPTGSFSVSVSVVIVYELP